MPNDNPVLVRFGASLWPGLRVRNLCDGEAFENAHRDIINVLPNLYPNVDCTSLPALNLFNSADSAIEQVRQMRTFLADQSDCTDIFLFYTGHGIVDGQADLRLMVQDTSADDELESSLSASSLAAACRDSRDKPGNPGLTRRTWIFLDCCYAGAAAGSFTAQGSGPDPVQRVFSLPSSGSLLIGAAPGDKEAYLHRNTTSLSWSLNNALALGSSSYGTRFNAHELRDLMVTLLSEDRERTQTAHLTGYPVVHGKQGEDRSLANVPLFHNRSHVGTSDSELQAPDPPASDLWARELVSRPTPDNLTQPIREILREACEYITNAQLESRRASGKGGKKRPEVRAAIFLPDTERLWHGYMQHSIPPGMTYGKFDAREVGIRYHLNQACPGRAFCSKQLECIGIGRQFFDHRSGAAFAGEESLSIHQMRQTSKSLRWVAATPIARSSTTSSSGFADPFEALVIDSSLIVDSLDHFIQGCGLSAFGVRISLIFNEADLHWVNVRTASAPSQPASSKD